MVATFFFKIKQFSNNLPIPFQQGFHGTKRCGSFHFWRYCFLTRQGNKDWPIQLSISIFCLGPNLLPVHYVDRSEESEKFLCLNENHSFFISLIYLVSNYNKASCSSSNLVGILNDSTGIKRKAVMAFPFFLVKQKRLPKYFGSLFENNRNSNCW